MSRLEVSSFNTFLILLPVFAIIRCCACTVDAELVGDFCCVIKKKSFVAIYIIVQLSLQFNSSASLRQISVISCFRIAN